MAGARGIAPTKPIKQACESALRPKPCLLAIHSKLKEIVASNLVQDWSSQQISGWLK